MAGSNAPASFDVVVPLKDLDHAKSRLRALGDESRRALAEAFGLDTVAAALECTLVRVVVVVTRDPDLVHTCRALGAHSVPDPAIGGLNDALCTGAFAATTARDPVRRDQPGLPGRPVALCGDLPALSAAALESVLVRAPLDRPSFVADAAGGGTTLYTAPTVRDFDPRFGAGSRLLHLHHGAVEIRADNALGVQQDVDTPADLHSLAVDDLGPRTRAVVTRLGLTTSRASSAPRRVEKPQGPAPRGTGP